MFRAIRPPKWLWLVVAGAVSFWSIAVAQEQVSTDDMANQRLSIEKSLSSEEQREEAARIEEWAKQVSKRQNGMLNAARKKRDIIQATCLDDKLTQSNANLRTLKSRTKALNAAIRANDTGRVKHEFTVIKVLERKFQILDHAASQCIGQDIFETGATTVLMEVDPDSPVEDATVIPRTPAVPPIVYIPPPVSGTS